MNKKPRLGFLGLGWIGRHRMKAARKSGVVEIAALSDPDPEMLAAASAVAPAAKTVESYQELLDRSLALDGIVIATPTALHAEQTLAALELGFPVFCQYPLGRNSYEVRKIVAQARRANRLLDADSSYRLTEGIQKIREKLQSGSIGDVYAADLVFHEAYGPEKQWLYDRSLSGGGCVMDLGVHLVDLSLWTLGFPHIRSTTSQLFSRGRRLSPAPIEVEDYATAQIELANGASIRLACSWKLPAGCEAVIEATFYGTKGALRLRNMNGSFYDFAAEHLEGTSQTFLCLPPDDWGGRALVEWGKKLQQSRGFDPAAENLISVSRVLDSIYGVLPSELGEISVIKTAAS